MSAIGCPIVGDALYYREGGGGGAAEQPLPLPQSSPRQQLYFYDDNDDDNDNDGIRWRSYNAMALQCCYLSFPYPTTCIPTSSQRVELDDDDDVGFSKQNKKERRKLTRMKTHNKNAVLVPHNGTKVVEYSLPTAWWSKYIFREFEN